MREGKKDRKKEPEAVWGRLDALNPEPYKLSTGNPVDSSHEPRSDDVVVAQARASAVEALSIPSKLVRITWPQPAHQPPPPPPQ